MIDKYKEDISNLIKKNGPMGVNQLSRDIGVPLSTLQKYLHKQTYFKINENKKWDLPENVVSNIKSNTLVLMTDVVETNVKVLKSQLEEMLQHVDNALVPISTLKKGVENISLPVADKVQSNIDKRLVALSDKADILNKVYKKHKENVPEIYQEVLFNFDYVGFILKENEQLFDEVLQDPIYELLLGKSKELAEDVVQLLKEHQLDTTDN